MGRTAAVPRMRSKLRKVPTSETLRSSRIKRPAKLGV